MTTSSRDKRRTRTKLDDTDLYNQTTSQWTELRAEEQFWSTLDGILADEVINRKEGAYLAKWVDQYRDCGFYPRARHIAEEIKKALADSKVTRDELDDLRSLITRLRPRTPLRNAESALIAGLHGVLAGIAADQIINAKELEFLRTWLIAYAHLAKTWPFSHVMEVARATLKDPNYLSKNHAEIMRFFAHFTLVDGSPTIDIKSLNSPLFAPLKGILTSDPQITIRENYFCFTGSSQKHRRKDLWDMVTELGGFPTESVGAHVNYLVVCGDGSRAWAYESYGRKIEAVLHDNGYRASKGYSPIVLVHEFDFLDAVQDELAKRAG